MLATLAFMLISGAGSSSEDDTEYSPDSLSEEDETLKETVFLAFEEATRTAPRGCFGVRGGAGGVVIYVAK